MFSAEGRIWSYDTGVNTPWDREWPGGTDVNAAAHQTFSVERFAHDGEQIARNVFLLYIDGLSHSAREVFHRFCCTPALQCLVRTVKSAVALYQTVIHPT